MTPLRVTVLGCGGSTGVPSLGGQDGRGDWGACDPGEPRNRRSRASILIQAPGGTILVDTGPDVREQLLANAVPRVDALIFTHAHADHVAGLDDVRLLNRIIGRPLPTYATQVTRDELARRFEYAFRPWTPPIFYRPVMDFSVIEPGDTIGVCGARIATFDQDHHVVRTLGLRVETLAYSTDVVRLDEAAFAALAGIDTWLVGCFQRQAHMTHAHIGLIDTWRQRLGVRRTILTHMGCDLDWAWMAANLPPGMEAAHDGMVLQADA